MLNFVLSIFVWQAAIASVSIEDCKKCMILCEQSQNRVIIVDPAENRIVWEWTADASNVARDHIKWFDHPDEAKPVYNNKFVLITASGGGVALVRISDKKTLFYAYAGGNPHSAEILPDGNIVSSSSTGNFLRLFKVDTLNFPDNISHKSYPIIDGHNVVWDERRHVLWAGSGHRLYAYAYNSDCSDPALTLKDSVSLPGNLHDLFPIYGRDGFWLTTDMHVYAFDFSDKIFRLVKAKRTDHIKSISSGPVDFPIIMIHPKEKWWTAEVISSTGERLFMEQGLRIYKARWFLENHFSYPDDHRIRVCQE